MAKPLDEWAEWAEINDKTERKMIDVKIIAKAKSGVSGGQNGKVAGQGWANVQAEADWADKAGTADKAKWAEAADKANSAAWADKAGRADIAEGLADYDEMDGRYLSKQRDDVAKGHITLEKGVKVGKAGMDNDGDIRNAGNIDNKGGFSNGGDIENAGDFHNAGDMGNKGDFLNEGNISNAGDIENKGDIMNADGTITTKNLTVTGLAHFFSLTIDEIRATGGAFLATPAGGFSADIVEDIEDSDNHIIGWRLYWRAEQDGKSIMNMWRAGDMAVCQTFNVGRGITYNAANKKWWRLVTATSNENASTGFTYKFSFDFRAANASNGAVTKTDPNTGIACLYHWIEVSNKAGEFMDGSSIPAAGDEVAQLGYQGTDDAARQSAIYYSAYSSMDAGLKAPFFAFYEGINDFELAKHRTSYKDADKMVVYGEVHMNSASKYTNKGGGEELLADKIKDMDGKIEGAYSAITLTNSSIEAVSNKIQTDADGNVTNVSRAGLVTEENFAGLFAENVDANKLVKRAEISTFVTKDSEGNLEADVKVKGDQISIEGATTINGNTKIDEEGNLHTKNATLEGYLRSSVKENWVGSQSNSSLNEEIIVEDELNVMVSTFNKFGSPQGYNIHLPVDPEYIGARVTIIAAPKVDMATGEVPESFLRPDGTPNNGCVDITAGDVFVKHAYVQITENGESVYTNPRDAFISTDPSTSASAGGQGLWFLGGRLTTEETTGGVYFPTKIRMWGGAIELLGIRSLNAAKVAKKKYQITAGKVVVNKDTGLPIKIDPEEDDLGEEVHLTQWVIVGLNSNYTEYYSWHSSKWANSEQ